MPIITKNHYDIQSHTFEIIVKSPNEHVALQETVSSHLIDYTKTSFFVRTEIPYDIWKEINEAVRHEFNVQLQKKGLQKYKRWTKGANTIDRMHGKELCVLFWAMQQARNEKERETILQRWLGLFSFERWWFFGRIVGEARKCNYAATGWYRGLYYGLAAPHEGVQDVEEN